MLAALPALASDPPPPPGPQARRSQNNVAHAIAGVSLAWAVEQRADLLAAAKKWTLAAHRLRALGLHLQQAQRRPRGRPPALRDRLGLRPALPRAHAAGAGPHPRLARAARGARPRALHAGPRSEGSSSSPRTTTSSRPPGLGVAALALIGESTEAERWAATAYAPPAPREPAAVARRLLLRGHRVLDLLGPLARALRRRLGARDRREPVGARTLPQLEDVRRARAAAERAERLRLRRHLGRPAHARAARRRDRAALSRRHAAEQRNVLYRVAARLRDPETQAVAERCRGFGHTNLEEYWTLLWRDPSLERRAHDARCRSSTTSRTRASSSTAPRGSKDALAFAFKAGPPEGHRAARSWRRSPSGAQSTGHAHPDAGSFIVWAGGRYARRRHRLRGRPPARHHNTVRGRRVGQGLEREHDVWEGMDRRRSTASASRRARPAPGRLRSSPTLAAAYPPAAGLGSSAASSRMRRAASACTTASRRARRRRSSGSCTRTARSPSTDRASGATRRRDAPRRRPASDGRAPAHGAHRSSPHPASPARSSRAARTSAASSWCSSRRRRGAPPSSKSPSSSSRAEGLSLTARMRETLR